MHTSGALSDFEGEITEVNAEAGRLNSLVGASDETFGRIRPMLDAYSEAVFHFGPVGAGHTAKLVNNFISMGYCALIAEGIFRDQFGVSGQQYAVPEALQGATNLGFMVLPNYRAWVVVASLLVCLVTWYVIERTKLGALLRGRARF